ncbi:MAG: ABC transporter ATP-binding protein [Clostridiales bacterium]|nr:MAG: ABC transporter ATP-binding protein [Clostridiales bacterium]
MSNVLETRLLVKNYGEKVALTGIDLSVPEGKIVGLLGSNGSGKTTLLKLAAGLLRPTKGEIRVCGMEVGVGTKRVVSFLPERTYLNDWMRVADILEFFEDFYKDFDKGAARRMLTELGVNENARLKTLSKGTKEKVQLVLVMARRARLYLLDEPIAGVDPVAREYILNTIIANYNPEASVIISTHLISDVEKVLDSFLFIRDGRIIMQDEVAKVKEEYGKSLDEIFREVYRCSEKA